MYGGMGSWGLVGEILDGQVRVVRWYALGWVVYFVGIFSIY